MVDVYVDRTPAKNLSTDGAWKDADPTRGQTGCKDNKVTVFSAPDAALDEHIKKTAASTNFNSLPDTKKMEVRRIIKEVVVLSEEELNKNRETKIPGDICKDKPNGAHVVAGINGMQKGFQLRMVVFSKQAELYNDYLQEPSLSPSQKTVLTSLRDSALRNAEQARINLSMKGL